MRRFPPPWTVEQIPRGGGYKVLDANRQSLAYVYGRERQEPMLTRQMCRQWTRQGALQPTSLSRQRCLA
jgi:hypothetical protein